MNKTAYIYDLCEELKARYDTNDPFEIARERDLAVVTAHIRSPLGMFAVTDNGDCVVLSDELDDVMRRVVAAHELGHSILHRDIAIKFGSLADDDLSSHRARTEYEANVFAAHLLLDSREVFETARETRYDIRQLAETLETDSDLLSIKIAEMVSAGYDLRMPEGVRSDFLKV